MPNGMGEGFRALAFFCHAGGLKARNAGVWGRAPGQLAVPWGYLPVHFWAKSQYLKRIYNPYLKHIWLSTDWKSLGSDCKTLQGKGWGEFGGFVSGGLRRPAKDWRPFGIFPL